MSHATFRFYAGLNHFLPYARRQTEFEHSFEGRVSIKDMIESFGVPHTEIDLILVNGKPVDFDYIVQEDDRVSVYPDFTAVDISPLIRLRPEPLEVPRFVLDIHLGRLAGYLRMLGFDTLYPENYDDEYLAEISSTEDRILLSRDRGLLMRKIVVYGYYVRSTNPRQQVVEVARRYNLIPKIEPFRRCAHCNGVIVPVAKDDILDRIQPDTQKYYNDFRLCSACGRVYWQGTHYERMQTFIEEIVRQCASEKTP
jgi:uncharacterized protein with PIN domain/sulfur carrier protein ThiS